MNPAFLLTLLFAAADQPTVTAVLQPIAARKAAPAFQLTDSTGRSATLKQYRGKVVLLDFWATWCHGCKLEIPWFAEFEKAYAHQGLAVVGVSLDEGGWPVVKPFLGAASIPYRILLGGDRDAQSYGIKQMPDTFIIDRKGRLAAAYTGVVDRENIESNIRAVLAQHP